MAICAVENIRASDIMTKDVVCLNEDLDLHECEKIFLNKGISGAPVVDVDGHLKGVLSKTDLITHHYVGGEEAREDVPYKMEDVRGAYVVDYNTPSAGDMMTPVPCVATEWATIGEVAALLVRRQVHRVVICKDRKVIGIVSSMDILRVISKEPAAEGWDPEGFPG
jgi:CBS domain-containing protein